MYNIYRGRQLIKPQHDMSCASPYRGRQLIKPQDDPVAA